jgi:UDP-glucose 4-epimerase
MSFFPAEPCLVTGGAGFIGSHLVQALVEAGCRVRVLDNLSTGSLSNLAAISDRVELIHGDLADRDAVSAAVEGCRYVFHQAALASVPLSVERPLDSHHACATGTLQILDAARRAGVQRVVYAASSSAYGNIPQNPKRETLVPEALSPYAAAKLAGELYCQSFAATYGLETVRLRYFNVFGPRQDPKSPYSAVIPLFADAILQGRTPRIYGTGEQSRDFVHVANVVQANLRAALAPDVSGQVFNVASGSTISVLELLQLICDLLGRPFEVDFYPPRPGDVLHSSADISLTQQCLGYRVETDLLTGLRETLNYYVEQISSGAAMESKLGHRPVRLN